MILLEPQQDELAIGHAGGLEFINRLPAYKFTDALSLKLRTEGLSPTAGAPTLELLALASGMGLGTYVARHTMLPAFRLAARPNACTPHTGSTPTYHLRYGLVTPRIGAYVCVECISTDLKSDLRYSWYRRIHHLLGVDWCYIHGNTLHRVEGDKPFSVPPHIWHQRDSLSPLDACAPNLTGAGEFINRFVTLSVATLNRENPLPSTHLKRKLSQVATSAGLRLAVVGSKPPLSDLVRELAPRKWLMQHINGLANKEPRTYFSRVDDFLVSGTPAATDSYLLAMAALYSSAEEALKVIGVDGDVMPLATSRKQRLTRGTRFWNGDVLTLYQRHKGDMGSLAEHLNMPRGQLTQRMASIGLPHLRGGATSSLWAALADFGSGMPIAKACERHQVVPEDLEALLRQAGARLINSVTQFRREETKPRNQRHRRAP